MRLWREFQSEKKQIESCRKCPPGTRISVVWKMARGKFNRCSIENLAQRIVNEGLSVRAVEEIISKFALKERRKLKNTKSSVVEFNEIAERIGDALDTRVSIQGSVQKGVIMIEFAGAEDLKRITQTIEG